MPIQHAIWKVGENPVPLSASQLASEQKLEEMIVRDPRILSSEWMLIGRQEVTSHGGRIDLLAITPDGSLVLIELKRDKTPREIVAQALDYASWVGHLTTEKIAQIYQRFSNGGNLDESFQQRFGTELDEETLNQSHQIIIVAAELDGATERIIGYLNARDIAINAVFFQVFQHGEEQLLSRAWLIDPGETQANVANTTKTKGEKEPWNGEYYVSYGDINSRNWDDARQYGYISAGGGSWYSQTLKMFSPGDRVWVKIPKTGYVGVGRVMEAVQPVKEFTVQTPTGERPALDVLKHADYYKTTADDPDKAEYFVRVEWLDTVPESNAVNEVGLFGNQNTVCQPTTPKWRHTVERLKTHFTKWDQQTATTVSV
jgi:hemin uptake protein HemP